MRFWAKLSAFSVALQINSQLVFARRGHQQRRSQGLPLQIQ